MKQIAFLLLLYLAAVAETAVIPRLDLGGAAPSLLLLLACPAATCGGLAGLLAAALIGFVRDAIAPSGMGVDLFWTVLAVWLLRNWLRQHPAKSIAARTSLAFVVVAALVTAGAVTRLLLADEAIDARALAIAAGGTALSSALVVLSVELAASLLRRMFVAGATAHRPEQHAW